MCFKNKNTRTSSIDVRENKVFLSVNEIEFMISFLLEYDLRGVAPVNHIDIELEVEQENRIVDLVVYAQDVAPPMSPKEFKNAVSK